MSQVIRAVYGNWPRYNRAFRDVVEQLTEEQLATRPAPERWPLWASVGHTACQRVFAFCDLLGAPGASTSMFPNAGFNCPGDDDLETVFNAAQLTEALDSTFKIVEWCLDNWTVESLAEELHNPDWTGDDIPFTRGYIVLRNFAHDISHIAETNETLSRLGLAQIDLWS
jgi:DinB superfamily